MQPQRFLRSNVWALCGLTLLLTLFAVLAQPALAALIWQPQTVDNGGYVGEYASLALDSAGNPVMSYYDLTNGNLKLIRCSNPACSSKSTVTVDGNTNDVGRYSALVLDSAGNPVISYHDITNRTLKLVKCGNATCTSGNSFQTVDSALNVGWYTALALDSAGNPVISYWDFGNGDLRVAKCSNPTCTGSKTIRLVDATGAVGEYTALALNSSGNPIISYYDATRGELKLVYCGDATCTSGNSFRAMDGIGMANVGQHTALKLDSSGNPVISYYDVDNGDLKLARCGNVTCTSGNSFQTVDSAGNVGLYTALALTSGGNPVISYYDITNRDLKVVRCGNVTCTAGNIVEVVDSTGDVGWGTALKVEGSGNPVVTYFDSTNSDLKLARLVDPALPTPTPIPPTPTPTPVIQTVTTGGESSLALDSSGRIFISYFDGTTQDLRLVRCGNATCSLGNTVATVDSVGDVGRFSSLEMNSQGYPVISYYDSTNGNLKLARCGNATCTSGNTIATVDSTGNVGMSTSLSLDGSGNPVISYSDNTNRDLKLARCGNATCTAGGAIATVDGLGVIVGTDNALALDRYGNPVISYFDGLNGDLRMVACGNSACTAANNIQIVDSAGFVGMFTSLALDSGGNPVISYYDDTNGALKLLHCGNAACLVELPCGFEACDGGNSFSIVDAGVLGKYTSLALNSSGNPVISYYDRGNYNLKVVFCGNSTCNADNTIRTVDSAGDVGMYTALRLDSSGNAIISYHDFTNQRLKLARVLAPGGVAASAASAIIVSEVVLTQPLTTTEVAPVPAVVETTAPNTTGQNQRLFLPLVANNGTMGASDSVGAGGTGAPISEAATQSAAVTATVATTLTLTGADPNAGVPSEPVTTTATAPVITTSAPVSVPMLVETAPIVTESVSASAPVSAPVVVESVPVITEIVPVSIPVVVEAAPVITESVPVSVPTAVEAAPAVTETLLLTTTQAITTDAAAATANPLAGTALGNQSGLVVLALVGLAVVGSLLWQRRRSSVGR
jgi:hypothetical protein